MKYLLGFIGNSYCKIIELKKLKHYGQFIAKIGPKIFFISKIAHSAILSNQ
jgi:hypothetical protein